MAIKVNSSFGQFVMNYLSELGWTMTDLSKQMGMSLKQISVVLNGKAQPSERFLRSLADIIPGTTYEMWSQVATYCEVQDRAETQGIEGYNEWSKVFAFNKLFQGRGMSKGEMLNHIQEAYGTTNLEDALNTPLRLKSLASFSMDTKGRGAANRDYLEAWLRLSITYDCVNEDKTDLRLVDQDTLAHNLAQFKPNTKLTVPYEVLEAITDFCNENGIYLCFSPMAPTTYVRGAMLRLQGKHYVILTDRYKSSEMLFLSFVHEVVHLINRDDLDRFDAYFTEHFMEEQTDAKALAYFVKEADLVGLTAPVGNSKILDLAEKNGVSFAMVVLVLQQKGIIDYAANRNVFHRFSYELATA